MENNEKVTQIVSDFVHQLTEKQIENLVNQKAKLKIVNVRVAKKTKPIPIDEADIDKICAALEKFTSKEEALTYLTDMKLKKAALKELYKHYKIPSNSKDTNSKMLTAIVEATVGSKLRFEALYRTKPAE